MHEGRNLEKRVSPHHCRSIADAAEHRCNDHSTDPTTTEPAVTIADPAEFPMENRDVISSAKIEELVTRLREVVDGGHASSWRQT